MAFSWSFFLACFATICLVSAIEATKNGGITVDLIHRDSPHSPMYDPSHTRFQRLNRAFQRSFSRKSSLTTTHKPDAIEASVIPIGGEYLMKIHIGTPPVEILGIADTGSDLTWTQCKPCSHCYKQKSPLFDPRETNSYRSVSCESEQCNLISGSSCDTDKNCKYQVSYGDRSYSIGDIAVETFTFEDSTSDRKLTFPKVAFGCGHENDGTFNETGSGIIGLGGGSISIINQLDKSIGGKFSYCLTSLDSNASSKISFGSNAIVTGPKVVSTPLIKKSPDTFYFLTLEGISVGGNKLEYNSKYNSKSGDYEAEFAEGNIIIDSGTTLTFLPRGFYEQFESTLARAIDGERVSDSQGFFNLCYKLPADRNFNGPPIIVHFSGADLEVSQVGTFVEVEAGVVCLTFVPSDDLSIFGNLHQMNVHVGYDIVNQNLNFLPTDCSKLE